MAVRVAVAGLAALVSLVLLQAQQPRTSLNGVMATAFTALASLACLVLLGRATIRMKDRRTWLLLGAALAIDTASEIVTVWAVVTGGKGLEVVGLILGVAVFPFSLSALVSLLKARLGRLPLAAWLDGMTCALVLQVVIALIFIAPFEAAIVNRGLSGAVTLLFPLMDLFVVGMVAAAAAHGGWRLDGWGLILVGLIAFTIGDCAEAANAARGMMRVGDVSLFAWLAGAWLLAAAAWSPVPVRRVAATARGWVPVLFGVVALGLLVGTSICATRSPLAQWLAAICMASVIARFAVTLRQNAEILRRVTREASTDVLTGLDNRRKLEVDLKAALGRCSVARPATLAMFDLNGFKEYNDTYGHPAGDALLAWLGQRLRGAVAGAASVYRMGGDEFCLLMEDCAEDAREVVARAGTALTVRSETVAIDVAGGLVELPAQAGTAAAALELADLRMYENKAAGRLRKVGSTAPEIEVLQRRSTDVKAMETGLAAAGGYPA